MMYQEFNASKFVVFTSLLLFSILFTLQLDRVLCFHEHYHQYVLIITNTIAKKRVHTNTYAEGRYHPLLASNEQDNLCFVSLRDRVCDHLGEQLEPILMRNSQAQQQIQVLKHLKMIL